MKKQLLNAAGFGKSGDTSVAMADISISGTVDGVAITGKSGDASVVAKIGLGAGNAVEQLYATSSVAGIKVKAGTWESGKGELGQNATGSARVAAPASFGGVKLSYKERNNDGISTSIAGVKLTRKLATGATFEATYTETKASGSMGGVSA